MSDLLLKGILSISIGIVFSNGKDSKLSHGCTTQGFDMIQDLELITAFMEKSMKKENIVTRSNHLKAHTICNNNQLLAKNEGIVADIHKSQDPQ